MTIPSVSKPRIEALDLTKGILVVLMVVYHSLNYTSEYYLSFRYLAFLPPSFIFITGYLISAVYFTRYDGRGGQVQQRLLTRGLKLLVLFTALNILAHLFPRPNSTGEMVDVFGFFEHWLDVFVRGSGRVAVFEVLLPISYLLMLAPALIWAGHRQRFFLPLVTLALVASCLFLDRQGYSLPNLNLLGAGGLGMLAGRLPSSSLGVVSKNVIITAANYGCYVYLSATLGQPYWLQLMGATIVVALIFGLCGRCPLPASLGGGLIRLGQYSLVAYIVQIGFLQLLAHFVHRPDSFSAGSALLFGGTLVLTIISISFIHRARARSTRVEKLYRALFA